MALPQTQNFDGATEGQTATSFVTSPWGWSGPAGGGTATVTLLAAAKDHGVRGARFTDLTKSQFLQFTDGVARDTSTFSWYFNIRTTVGAVTYLCSLTSTTGKETDLRVNTDLSVTIRNVNTAAATSSAKLSTATWYRAEYTYSGTTQTLNMYLGEASTMLFSLTGACSGNDLSFYNVGNIVVAGTGAIDYDTVRVTATPPGPFAGVTSYKKAFLRVSGSQVAHSIARITP